MRTIKNTALTHHFEVFSVTLRAPVETGQQHLLNVVACPVVKLPHVKRAGLEVVKVGSFLQDLQHVLLDQVWVPDLIPGNRQVNMLISAER